MPQPEPTSVNQPFQIRTELAEIHRQVWDRIGQPGTWLSGAQRVRIAAETRAARTCALCRERKAALSPYAVEGTHDVATGFADQPDSQLDPVWIDAIHRIVTDPGRLSKRLVDDLAASGCDDAMYVEMLGVALFALSIDTFHLALGLELWPLPAVVKGAPTRARPDALEDIDAWVPVLAGSSPLQKQIHASGRLSGGLPRALTLVPAVAADHLALLEAQYVPLALIPSTGDPGRAINRTQIELVASRVSALNECFY